MTEPAIRRRAIVHGRVQGVWFRDTTRQQARAFGVSGWVRNRLDGTVEAVLEAPPDAMQRMLQFLEQGPPRAHVEQLEVHAERPAGLTGFEIR